MVVKGSERIIINDVWILKVPLAEPYRPLLPVKSTMNKNAEE